MKIMRLWERIRFPIIFYLTQEINYDLQCTTDFAGTSKIDKEE